MLNVTSSFPNGLVAGNSMPVNISNALKIDGWMSERELEWLGTIAQESEVIIEIGCYKGRSTRVLADNCIGRIYCIDPWNGICWNSDNSFLEYSRTDVYDEFCRNLQDHLNSGRVKILQGTSQDYLFSKCADLVFIDGDHQYKWVKNDIKRALEWVRPNGIVAGHDYYQQGWQSIKRAVDESFPNVNKEDSIWWTQK